MKSSSRCPLCYIYIFINIPWTVRTLLVLKMPNSPVRFLCLAKFSVVVLWVGICGVCESIVSARDRSSNGKSSGILKPDAYLRQKNGNWWHAIDWLTRLKRHCLPLYHFVRIFFLVDGIRRFAHTLQAALDYRRNGRLCVGSTANELLQSPRSFLVNFL